MHLLSASCVRALLIAALLRQAETVENMETVIGRYGETLEIPCKTTGVKEEDIRITKWKYVKENGLSEDLLLKRRNENVSINTVDDYKDRVSMSANFSLLLSSAKLSDQHTFTCIQTDISDIREFFINLVVYKAPTDLSITDKAEELEIGKPTKLGTCVATDANPPATITWLKNNKPLVDGEEGISVDVKVQKDPTTGLLTTYSTLEYSAMKEDTKAEFSCSTQHAVAEEMVSPVVTFTITYSTENIDLQFIAQEPLEEGDNVTLTCVADGNPKPTSFNFHLKGDVVTVANGNSYKMVDVSRDATGEYKCSLTDNPTMESSKWLEVKYLDINLSPSGRVTKSAGESLDLMLQINASHATKVSWAKDNAKLSKEPKFTELVYSNTGRYECNVTMGLVSRTASFELVVEGAPVIRQLSKKRSDDGHHKVLICEAEGSPRPSVYWSINGTSVDDGSFVNGKVTHKIKVVPTANLSVSCTVSNDFGMDSRTINVSSLFEDVRVDKQDQQEEGSQTKMVVGVVVGLLVATVVIGLAYWVYMKKAKQGSWKTGEKENGSSEEEKKLEEKVEENSQKAEV